MVLIANNQCADTKPNKRTVKVSACVMFANTLLAKVSHMAEPRTNVGEKYTSFDSERDT